MKLKSSQEEGAVGDVRNLSSNPPLFHNDDPKVVVTSHLHRSPKKGTSRDCPGKNARGNCSGCQLKSLCEAGKHSNFSEDTKAAPSESPSSDVREQLASLLPNCWQLMLTRLTGKARRGEVPKRPKSPGRVLAETICVLGLSVATTAAVTITASLVPAFIPLALPVGFVSALVTAGSIRHLQTTEVHYAAHRSFHQDPAINDAVGVGLSTFITAQQFEAYRHDHVDIHHTKDLCTLKDPDAQLMVKLGFLPGQPIAYYWKQLRKSLLSPMFHWYMVRARIRHNLGSQVPLKRRVAAWIWSIAQLLLPFTVSALLHSPAPILACVSAWWIPLTLGVSTSALLQFSSEHAWFQPHSDTDRPYHELKSELTAARFCGEEPPANSSPLNWVKWGIRMIFIHGLTRAFVLCGTLPVHDFHHRDGKNFNWPSEFYLRQKRIEEQEARQLSGKPRASDAPFIEVWGLRAALERSFAGLASLPPLTEEEVIAAELSPSEFDQALLAM